MTFADKVLHYNFSLTPDWKLPNGFNLLYPFGNDSTRQAMQAFYNKYYSDTHQRIFLFGINPGRFGAGVTGVPFTDPVRLEDDCGIKNGFKKRQELSSVYVYHFINAFGGPEKFYKDFYITSICPLGFTTNGINVNYYDDKKLQTSVMKHIENNLLTQFNFGHKGGIAISLGRGKNFKFFQKINERLGIFDEVLALPHPRWVMQYRRKRMEEFIEEYLACFQNVLEKA